MTRNAPATDPLAVIAVDVGNSKTDLALVTAAGVVAAALRGPTSSHQQVGPDQAIATLVAMLGRALLEAGLDPEARPVARLVAYSGAGVDFPSDVRLIARGLRRAGLAPDEVIVNDTECGLRAGTDRGWGVCVICGSGINCVGIAPDGRTARFDALGPVSGDWGGGGALGEAALAAAVRAEDGRGLATSLERSVPAWFGVARPRSLVSALYRRRVAWTRIRELAPLVFAAATGGDAVARGILDRQADEVVAWAVAAIRRLRLQRRDPDVVLAGGVFRADDPAFYARIQAGVTAVAPAARLVRLTAPPVVGSALLGLDRLAGGPTPTPVERRLRAELTHERLVGHAQTTA